MSTKPWRQRVHEEDELLEQLRTQTSAAAERRAHAYADGVDELGTVYKVAKALDRPWTTVDQAIKRHGLAKARPDTTP
ncbi:hypothetical protein ACN24M_24555 [Streptomyces microflavus]|uniref:hypothetical protein n=1 Tax=Streptomyces microflavus TaxID=1919 RepID=UPI003B2213CE